MPSESTKVVCPRFFQKTVLEPVSWASLDHTRGNGSGNGQGFYVLTVGHDYHSGLFFRENQHDCPGLLLGSTVTDHKAVLLRKSGFFGFNTKTKPIAGG